MKHLISFVSGKKRTKKQKKKKKKKFWAQVVIQPKFRAQTHFGMPRGAKTSLTLHEMI
jgi:hypothetical protein